MVGARWVYGGLLIIQQLVVRCQRSFSSFDGRPYIQITFLSLDGANHDALDEVFLEHRVDEEDRDGGHHHRGILDAFADRGGGIRRQTGGHGAYAVGDQDLTQHQLQRVLGTGAQIEHGVEPGVPVTDGVEQHHDGQRRLRKRKDDAEEDLEVVGAVDPCRFLHVSGISLMPFRMMIRFHVFTALGSTMAQKLSYRPMPLTTRKVGIMPPPKNMVKEIRNMMV